ncbi:hypothetical protein BHUM_03583 [Candidatus Burkholderia humilis]|nr:hypothetical protein BHUM_03583 [Candidatus Burkholderia humilis]
MQNRLSIEYLLDLWQRAAPDVELVIYGHMIGHYEAVSNVSFAGFAPSHADVYTPQSVALCPAFLAGGIKSKVMEVIAYGCVPIGNAMAFEGLGFNEPALAISDTEFERFIMNHWPYMDAAVQAAERFAA